MNWNDAANWSELSIKLTKPAEYRNMLQRLISVYITGRFLYKQCSYGYTYRFENIFDKILAVQLVKDVEKHFQNIENTGKTKASNIAVLPKSL